MFLKVYEELIGNMLLFMIWGLVACATPCSQTILFTSLCLQRDFWIYLSEIRQEAMVFTIRSLCKLSHHPILGFVYRWSMLKWMFTATVQRPGLPRSCFSLSVTARHRRCDAFVCWIYHMVKYIAWLVIFGYCSYRDVITRMFIPQYFCS